MTTLKITFYENIKSVLVLVNHHFLILGGEKKGGGGNLNVWTEFFFKQIIIFFHKDIDNYEDGCYDFQDEFFLILNKYWECHEITECLKIYSWSKHVKQINEFLMAMRNMSWHKFLYGQTIFFSVGPFF